MKDKFPCPKCESYDIEISYATISGLDMPTAVYGFTKYDYTCHKCGDSGYQWVQLLKPPSLNDGGFSFFGYSYFISKTLNIPNSLSLARLPSFLAQSVKYRLGVFDILL